MQRPASCRAQVLLLGKPPSSDSYMQPLCCLLTGCPHPCLAGLQLESMGHETLQHHKERIMMSGATGAPVPKAAYLQLCHVEARDAGSSGAVMCVSSNQLRVTAAVTDVGAGWWARRVCGQAAAHAAAILPAGAVPAARSAAWSTLAWLILSAVLMGNAFPCRTWHPSFTYPSSLPRLHRRRNAQARGRRPAT